MLEGVSLVAGLRRIRRRIRFRIALEGVVAGAAVGLAVAALITVLGHHRGTPVGLGRPAALVLAGCVIGGLARALRRIPLARCARAADAALDRQDRALSALSLIEAGAGTPVAAPLTRALIADAAARVGQLAPEAAVPARRPRALPALAAGALAAALAGLSPVRSRAAIMPPPATPAPALAHKVLSADLEVEQEEARRAREAARTLEDARLAALAAELTATLRRLQAGTLDEGAALEALKSIEAHAGEAASTAEKDRRALEAAERALSNDAATRPAGTALGSGEADAADQARAALGASAEAHAAQTARALEAASLGVSASMTAPPESAPGEKGQRRLSRDGRKPSNAGASGGEPRQSGGEDERRLERLSRDLKDTADACKDGSPECRAQAENRARDLSRLAQRAAAAEPLRRLERAARQMRERVGRGEMGQDQESGQRGGQKGGDPQASATRDFQRAARGKGAPEGSGTQQGSSENGAGKEGKGSGEASGSSPGETGEGGDGEPGRPLLTERETGGGTENMGSGDGAGKEAGGPPLGQAQAGAGRARDREAQVADGAGPNRARVIGAAADRGFASPGYARVFQDYQGAVEEALGASAVPEGKRYIVRRYFDLIRPRGGRR